MNEVSYLVRVSSRRKFSKNLVFMDACRRYIFEITEVNYHAIRGAAVLVNVLS
jgi:hypothetical protein